MRYKIKLQNAQRIYLPHYAAFPYETAINTAFKSIFMLCTGLLQEVRKP